MPRPNKTFRRHKINAGIAYKRGDRKEAYELWAKAAAGIKELHEKKRNKNKPEEKTPEPTEGAPETTPG